MSEPKNTGGAPVYERAPVILRALCFGTILVTAALLPSLASADVYEL